jgi:5-methyltetrahydrofolate corrinoid/iron sulfur protein methyltransferase
MAVARRDGTALKKLIAQLVTAGAEAIDINTGPLNRRGEEQMVFCIENAAAATDRPLFIDTVNSQAIRAALTVGVSNRLIINGFSLEPAKLERILPLAVEFDVEIIGYLLDEHSRVPASLEEKLDVAMALYQHALTAGLRPEQLIIDPVVAPLSWQDAGRHNQALLDVLRLLPDMLGYSVKTAAGLSNLTTGAIARHHKERLEQAFIPMLASHGLSILLANMQHRRSVDMTRLSGWILDAGVFAWRQAETGGERR